MVVWKSIPGFTRYEASDDGHVRNAKTKRVFMEQTDNAGYKSISLVRDVAEGNSTSKTSLVHIFVALAFLPNPENKKTVNHKNRVRDDNRVTNLEWSTMTEQNRNRVMKPSTCGFRAVWKCDPVTGARLERFDSVTIAAKAFGRGPANISNVASGSGCRQSAYGFRWEHDDYPVLPGEMWKDIDPDLIGGKTGFSISSEGRVKSYTGRISTGYIHSSGYIKVSIGGQQEYTMHRIVAQTFLPNFGGKEFVNHKDGDKTNARLFNLEFATASENILHAFDTGLNTNRKPIQQLSINGEFMKEHRSLQEAADAVGLKNSNMLAKASVTGKVRAGFLWKLV